MSAAPLASSPAPDVQVLDTSATSEVSDNFHWTAGRIILALVLFLAAGGAEIGGGWLVWQSIRASKPWWFAFIGSCVLIGYGFIPTLQPIDNFGRVYAVYGGFFIVLSYAWGWALDGERPDIGDYIGAAIALVGVAIAFFWPRRVFLVYQVHSCRQATSYQPCRPEARLTSGGSYAAEQPTAMTRQIPMTAPAGVIFGCTPKTQEECMTGLFGLPATHRQLVLRLLPGTPVFLFNMETRMLFGCFRATSRGGWNLNPLAWGGNPHTGSPFPCQVTVEQIFAAPPVHEVDFKPVLKCNYFSGNKFNLELTAGQVHALQQLFQEAANRLWCQSHTVHGPAAAHAPLRELHDVPLSLSRAVLLAQSNQRRPRVISLKHIASSPSCSSLHHSGGRLINLLPGTAAVSSRSTNPAESSTREADAHSCLSEAPHANGVGSRPRKRERDMAFRDDTACSPTPGSSKRPCTQPGADLPSSTLSGLISSSTGLTDEFSPVDYAANGSVCIEAVPSAEPNGSMLAGDLPMRADVVMPNRGEGCVSAMSDAQRQTLNQACEDSRAASVQNGAVGNEYERQGTTPHRELFGEDVNILDSPRSGGLEHGACFSEEDYIAVPML